MNRAASKSKQRAQLVRDVIATLAEWFPAAFLLDRRRRPLKLGIDRDIAVATAGAITVAEIKAALRFYAGNSGYLRACVKGAARVDLNGSAAGTVTPDEAAYARHRLTGNGKSSIAATSRRIKTKPAAPQRVNNAVPVKRMSLRDLRDAAQRRKMGGVP